MQTLYLIDDVISGVTLKSLMDQFNKDDKDVLIAINSYGGSVYEGAAIYNWIGQLNELGYNVDTRNIGICASIASVIFCAGRKRQAAPMSQLMIHHPLIDGGGNAKDLRASADELDAISSNLRTVYTAVASLDDATLSQMMDNETFMNAEQAMEYGFVTEITKNETDKTVKAYFNLKNIPHKAVAKLEKPENMDFKDLLNFKNRFKAQGEEPVAKMYSLADGTEIETNSEGDLAVGDVVTVGGEPAPDATHQLEDGTQFVTVDGVVTEILPVAAGEDDFKAELEAVKAENKDLKEAVNALLQSAKDQQEAIMSLRKDIRATIVSKKPEVPARDPKGTLGGMSKAEQRKALMKDKFSKSK